MPDADEVEGTRRLVHLTFAEISRHDLSSSPSPPRTDLPPLLRFCLLLLPILNAGDPNLAVRCGRRLLAFLRAILSRDPDPSLLPALEMFAENLVVSDQLRRCFTLADGAGKMKIIYCFARSIVSYPKPSACLDRMKLMNFIDMTYLV